MGLRKLECSTCGAELAPEPRAETVSCRYCHSTFAVPSRTTRAAAYPAPQVTYSRGPVVSVVIAVALAATIGVGASIYQLAQRAGGSAEGEAGVPPMPIIPTPDLGAVAALAPGTEPRLAHELDLYVRRCFNDLGPSVLRSRHRYLDWADAERGPSRRSRHVYGLYEVDDATDCRAAIAQAEAMTPSRPGLEAAGRAYADAATRAHELSSEAHVYYERENHRDDDFQKGRELHGPLLSAFAAFEEAHLALERELDAAFEEVVGQQADHLGRGEDDTGMLVLQSQLAARQIAETSNVEWQRIPSIDLEAYQTLVAGYETLIDRMSEGALADESYLGASTTLALAAKELLRRRRDGQGFRTGERMLLRSRSAHWMVGGSPGKVVDAYNDLLRASPSPALRWVAPTEYLLR